MPISNKFIENLRSRMSISSVIGRFVKLEKKGNKYLGLCPFHKEKTPSFNVVEDKHYYHCFGCGAHGDAIDFYMKMQNLTFIEALKVLSNEVGLELPEFDNNKSDKEKKEIEEIYISLELANIFFINSLKNNGKALKYIKKRNLNQKTLDVFKIGYAPKSGLISYLKDNNVKDEIIEKSGLGKRDKKGELYDFFRDRVMFPIVNINNKTVAFGGRFIGDNKVYKVAKYINSSENILFDKSQILYNLKNAKINMPCDKSIIVVEGYMDVISLYMHGIKNAVAPMGTSITVPQVYNLWKSCDDPIFCLDGDEAGKKAGFRVAKLVFPELKPGKSISFVNMPDNIDPDDFIKSKGASGFKELLLEKVPLSDFTFYNFYNKESKKTPEIISKIEKNLILLANEIKDSLVAKEYRSFFKNKIWEQKKLSFNKGNINFDKNNEKLLNKLSSVKKSKNRLQQEIIIACFLSHPNVIQEYIEKVNFIIKDIDLKKMLIEIKNYLLEEKNEQINLIKNLENKGFENKIKSIFSIKNYMLAPQIKKNKDIKDVKILLDEIINNNLLISQEQSIKDSSNVENTFKMIQEKEKLEKIIYKKDYD